MFSKKRTLSLLSLLAAMLLLVACGGTQEETYSTVTSSAGFTVELPDSWASEDSTEEGFWFANSQDVLDRINADEATDGAGGNIQIEAAETMGVEDPVELLNLLVSFFTAEGGDELTVVSEAAAIEGHPQVAAKAKLRGDLEDLTGDITAVVVIGSDKVAVALIVDTSTDGEFDAVIERIAASIELE